MSETVFPNTTLGQYTIVSKIGEGGMGEVWRARDPKLGRDVAIKVLPAALSADKDRLARFEQEARAAGALNHPNILVIYHIGTHECAPFIVSELLEGESLRERMAGNALPQRKAIDYALQLARGLAAAHEKGIVHRDIKPDNVFITDDGRVKILDFGIAKLTAAVDGNQPQTEVPTRKVNTDPGTVMGTAGYMSPEQLKGLTVDHRSDIFSFGAILYEMLSGKRAFRGNSIAETMSAILREDPPDLSETNKTVSPALERVVRHCLEKNPTERFHSARDLAFAIESLSGSAFTSGQTATMQAILTTEARETTRLPRLLKNASVAWIIAGVCLVGLMAALLPAFRYLRQPRVVDPAKAVFHIQPPSRNAGVGQLAISPDGRTIAVVTTFEGTNRIWLRPIDSLEGRPVPGTEGAGGFPFWSPDGRSIAFMVRENIVKRIDLADGTVRDLAAVSPDVRGFGGTWNRDGTILMNQGGSGIVRVPASGGESHTLSGYESRSDWVDRWPSFLPDGKHFVFLTTSSTADDKSELFIGSIDSPERKLLFASDSNALYSPSPTGRGGHLLFARGGALLAQGFDADTRELIGEPFRVAERVRVNFNNRAFASVSENGTLVYDSSTDHDEGRQLTWFDRSGKAIETVGEAGAVFRINMSADERFVSTSRRSMDSQKNDVIVSDIARGASLRLSNFAGAGDTPVSIWSPDGKYVVWNETAQGKYRLVKKLSTGAGEAEVLIESPVRVYPSDWSPDGKVILYSVVDNITKNDVWALPLEADRKPSLYFRSPGEDWKAVFSPDGKYIAYSSGESGKSEIHVQTWPVSANKWPVSTTGGSSPRWPKNGREIFYVSNDAKMMSVAIKLGNSFEAGVPQPLFDIAMTRSPRNEDYVVSSDGRRLLFISRDADAASMPLVVILNWSFGLTK